VRPPARQLSRSAECRLSVEPQCPRRADRPAVRVLQLSLWDGSGPAALPPAPGKLRAPAAPSPADDPQSVVPPRPAIDLDLVFATVFRRLRLRREPPVFHASFRAFTGLRSTVRLKARNTIEARVSDLLAEARPLVIEALAEILLTRLYRVRPSREARECYQAWAHSPDVMRRIDEVRRQRGRKRMLPPGGRCFNLKGIFDELNRRFFSAEMEAVRIGWSPNRSRTMLGHYDSSHRSITITRWLDGPRVPRYVVEYLVFHEMLHVRFPVEHRNHRRVVHSPAFVAAERAFPDYARATRWLRTGKGRGAGEAPW
jgi:hypothetical protein